MMLLAILLLIKLGVILATEQPRLPRYVEPINYNLKITGDFSAPEFTFSGKVDILIRCISKKKGRNITMHSEGLAITKYSLKNNETQTTIKIDKLQYIPETDYVIFFLGSALKFNKTYILSLSYSKNDEFDTEGFAKESYWNETLLNYETIYWSQFKPSYARRVFPCFDEPIFKATFDLTLARPSDFKSLSNMPLKSSMRKKDIVYDQFERTPIMSTYVLGFVISKYPFLHGREEPCVNFTIWGPYENFPQYTLVANKIGSIYTWLRHYLQVPQPIIKTDLVAVNKLDRNGMENWGLFTLHSKYMLNHEGSWFVYKYARSETLSFVSFLLAHNWFGNLVTPKWWSDVWLSEGISFYFSFLSIENELPEVWDVFMFSKFQLMLLNDSGGYIGPLRREVKSDLTTYLILKSATSIKGSIIIRMLRDLVGADIFQQSMNKYLMQNAYSNVEQEDLWRMLPEYTNGTNITTKEVMDSWTLQSAYPLLTINVDYDSKTINISQKEFLDEESEKIWKIPFHYQVLNSETQQLSTTGFQLLTSENTTLLIEGIHSESALIANLGVIGFFRVNYDNQTWENIIKQLQKNHNAVHVFNRAQLIDDSFILAENKLENYTLPLSISSYLINETHPLPWVTFFKHLNIYIEKHSVYILEMDLLVMANTMTKSLFDSLNSTSPDPNGTINGASMKKDIWKWACLGGNGNCLKSSNETLEIWMDEIKTTNFTNLDPNIFVGISCMVVRGRNDTPEYDFVMDQMDNYPGLSKEIEECKLYENEVFFEYANEGSTTLMTNNN